MTKKADKIDPIDEIMTIRSGFRFKYNPNGIASHNSITFLK